ncbi:hypothetical protein BCA37_10680 [Mycobacterium sp. djl-10]|nr:hypothetical protein BCA37_10680 [Mycobacterium sp. djl-10]
MSAPATTEVCHWWIEGTPCDCSLDAAHAGDHQCSCGRTFNERSGRDVHPPYVCPLPDDLKGH